jgi:hypothetical protein
MIKWERKKTITNNVVARNGANGGSQCILSAIGHYDRVFKSTDQIKNS